MKRRVISLSSGLLVSVLTCAVVWAQATAQISGSVRDQTGAVLPGVEITVTQTDTGISRNTITNETGSYVLPNLAVGPYRLEAALAGFRSYARSGIVLQVNSNPVINVVLEIGQVSETVEVQANATLVETRNVGVGQVMENARILSPQVAVAASLQFATGYQLDGAMHNSVFGQIRDSLAPRIMQFALKYVF